MQLAGTSISAISGESLRRQNLKQNIAKETRCKLLNVDYIRRFAFALYRQLRKVQTLPVLLDIISRPNITYLSL
jgi:hypothetical protein